MNIDNLNKAIAVMTRAGKINMDSWQTSISAVATGGKLSKTEKEIHSCGTAACFAGWIGVSPEWAAAGGTITRSGEPFLDNGNTELQNRDAKMSLATWLDLPPTFVEMLLFSTDGSIFKRSDLHESFDNAPCVYSIYTVPFNELTSIDIINTLVRLRDLGFVEFLKEEIIKLKALDIPPENENDANLIEWFEGFIFNA